MEPDAQSLTEAKFDEQPSVLQKLQKWGDYEAYGTAVAPTNFVPMKTPLGSEILQNWNLEEPPRYPLSVLDLLDGQKSQGRKIGMIIDLSNHETLYGADLRETDVRYERVPLVAKVFPTQRAVNRVIEVAERFWSENPDLYIAIHCAYGFNRTGFVVCSYLIQACNLTVQDALDSFAIARPPGIRHDQFVAELHKRYDSAHSERCIPGTSSLSDLRGYGGPTNRQIVGSLHSDFLGVAEHLQENHPSLAERLTVSTIDSSVHGNSDSQSAPGSPPRHPQRPPAKGRGGLATISAVSFEGATSNCESVNNESLDLDEREIYKQFANRQLAGSAPVTEIANGHHRRKPIATALPTLRQSEDSNHSVPSPFASVQTGEEIFADTLLPDSAELRTDGVSEVERGASTSNCRESLPIPNSAGVSSRDTSHWHGSHPPDDSCSLTPPRGAQLSRGPVTGRLQNSADILVMHSR